MQPIVGINTDQMSIESCMVDFGRRYAIGYYRLAEGLILVLNDVGCVEQQRLRQARRSTSPVICGNNSFAERALMQTLLD
jgi:hypothetical protein